MIDDITRRQRRRLIGSSDAAAIVGVDPWKSDADVWARITGRLTTEPAAGPAAEVGSYLEAGVLDWAEHRLGTRLSRDLSLVHGHLGANLDGAALALAEPAIVEAKTAGMLGGPLRHAWGDDGTDQVPEHVLVQVHHQLNVARAQPDLPPFEWVVIPALLVGRGFVLYRVRRNPDLCDALLEAEQSWWQQYVEGDVMPEALPRLDVLRAMRREERTVTLDDQLVEAWLAARAAVKVARQTEDEALRHLIAALGDADAGVCSAGRFTFLEQHRKAYQVPDATFRVARWKETR